MFEGKDGLLIYSNKKNLNLSRSRQLAEFVQRAETEKIKSVMDNRGSVVVIIGLFACFMGVDILFPATEAAPDATESSIDTTFIIKALIAVSIVLALAKMLLKGRSVNLVTRMGPEPVVNFNFDVKAISYMMATPDEISTALIDPSQRLQWDNGLTALEKIGDDSIRLTYENADGSTYQEQVTMSNYFDKFDRSGAHFIMEHVNGEFHRFYELQAVHNRPFYLRVTLYTKVSPSSFKVRGKDTFRSLSALTHFIQQSGREGQAPMVLRKTEQNGEEVTSIKPQGFDLIQEDEEQQSVIEDDEEDALDQETERKPAPAIRKLTKEELKDDESVGGDLLAQLGPFVNSPEMFEKPVVSIYHIPDYEPLMNRYQPKYHGKLHLGLIRNSSDQEGRDHALGI